MSEQFDPSLGPIPQLPRPSRVDDWRDAGEPQLSLTAHRPQVTQRERTSLMTLLDGLREPAILHRDGRIVAMNAPFRTLLGHPAPDTLIGLPADALLDHVGPASTGTTWPATLTTPHGPLSVGLSTLDLDLRDDRGTLWLIGPVPSASAAVTERARNALDALCEKLWEGEMPDRKSLMDALTGVSDLLGADQEEEVERTFVDLADAVSNLVPEAQLDIFRRPAVELSPDALLHLLHPLLSRLAKDARVRVDVDVSGRPVVVMRRAAGPVLPADALADAQVLASALRASLVGMDGDRVVRLRLPVTSPECAEVQRPRVQRIA